MSAGGVPVEEIARLAGHKLTSTAELVYRRELRPVITTGAEVMDKVLSLTGDRTLCPDPLAGRTDLNPRAMSYASCGLRGPDLGWRSVPRAAAKKESLSRTSPETEASGDPPARSASIADRAACSAARTSAIISRS
jgi:hypothetical protein